MKIEQARALQKKLFKHSLCDFKRMKTMYYDDKLVYTVSHRLSKEILFEIDERFVRKLLSDLEMGITLRFEIITEDIKKEFDVNIPTGFYVVEMITID